MINIKPPNPAAEMEEKLFYFIKIFYLNLLLFIANETKLRLQNNILSELKSKQVRLDHKGQCKGTKQRTSNRIQPKTKKKKLNYSSEHMILLKSNPS
jgi:hypothetical protein